MRNNQGVLSALPNFPKRVDNIHCDVFKWSACRKEMNVTSVAILRIISSTTCADTFYSVDVGSRMGPVEGSSESVNHSALAGRSLSGEQCDIISIRC